MVIVGIDYGSKMAGTTALAVFDTASKQLTLSQSIKGRDADQFIIKCCQQARPALIGLDAPLSLPGVYTGKEGCHDYFYRQCDKELGAMSPMFLGGLTARAMKLRGQLEKDETKVYEVYPKMVARSCDLANDDYKKAKTPGATWVETLEEHSGFPLPQKLENWHQADALLALIGTIRIAKGIASKIGRSDEGFIYF